MAKLLLFAGLLALACMTQAARVPSDVLSMLDSLPQSMVGFQGAAKQQDSSNEDTSAAAQVVGSMMGSAAYSDLEVMLATSEHVQKGKGKGKWHIHVSTKFLVKPDMHINFLHRWWSYNAGVRTRRSCCTTACPRWRVTTLCGARTPCMTASRLPSST
ncbi:hypothetical protein COO60DRAFT_100299 [Scenedesmus sp. NREL 46B-D3]|nr:hypothetical protein COO60DRAFT_100299 [Scenedesmus sp. NREL 46B-D3]